MVVTAKGLRERCAHEMSQNPRGFGDCSWLREAFLDVPREHFVPDKVWWPAPGEDGRYPLIDRAEKPWAWLKAAYRPGAALITQIDDGAVSATGPAKGAFTSSISAPGVTIELIRHLDPEPGDSILEIGTGTGYTTALLVCRSGSAKVTTVEIDAGLAARARACLRALGMDPHVVTGDGERGHADGAPYDRILSTASVRQVPAAWLRQLKSGGVLIAPLDSPFGCDLMVRFVGDGHGRAVGAPVAQVEFMRVRSQRVPRSYEELGWPAQVNSMPWTGLRITADATGQRVTAGAALGGTRGY